MGISCSKQKFDGDVEQMIELFGANGAVDVILKAEKLFKDSQKKFSNDDRPIPMTVSEWKMAQEEADEDAANEAEEEEDGSDDQDDNEDGEEEEGEDEPEDEEPAEPPAKKAKA